MKFQVKRQYARDIERPFAAFMDVNDAKFFVEEKLSQDAALKLKTVYRLYDDRGKLLEERDPNKEESTQSTSASGAGQSQSNQNSASPNPFSTSLRPAGFKWPTGGQNSNEEKK